MLKVIVFVISTLTLYASPSWYYKLPSKGTSFYIGYGQGLSESEAKKVALNDISSQISVHVKSSISSDSGRKNGQVYQDVHDESSLSSSAQIQGYKVEKLEVEEGKYFIALSYENIPSIDKFNKKVASVLIDENEAYNSYLQKTPIANELQTKMDFKLKRKDGLWYIQYKNIYQALDKKDFSHFFTSSSNPSLSITTSKRNNILHDGDEFFFKINSKEAGFITIFTVYEDGTVAKLMSNIAVKKGKTENIPDKDFESILQAGLIEEGKETFDLYVVLRTKIKQHFDRFARADEELISDERYKNFDELIGLMNEVDYVSLKLVTKPR